MSVCKNKKNLYIYINSRDISGSIFDARIRRCVTLLERHNSRKKKKTLRFSTNDAITTTTTTTSARDNYKIVSRSRDKLLEPRLRRAYARRQQKVAAGNSFTRRDGGFGGKSRRFFFFFTVNFSRHLVMHGGDTPVEHQQ